MNNSKYDSIESATILKAGEYTYVTSNPTNGYTCAVSGYTPFVKSMYIEDFFIKLAFESEKLKKKRKHLRLDDVARIMVSVPEVDFTINFGNKPMSEIDLKDIKNFFKLGVDNVYMLILKSDPNTIRFATDDLDYEGMGMKDE